METPVSLTFGNPWVSLIVITLSLSIAAFFSGSEAAIISVSKIRIRNLAEQGNRAAQAVQWLTQRHEKFFATILLMENFFLIFASAVGTSFFLSLLGEGGEIVASVVMTYLIVTFAEITPKTLAAQKADTFAPRLAPTVRWVVRILDVAQVLRFFTLVPKVLIRILGGNPDVHRTPVITEDELRMLIHLGAEEGVVPRDEERLLHKVFIFGDRLAREVMVPRPDMVSIARTATVQDFLDLFTRTGHTRLPVLGEGGIDDVRGIISAKEVLMALHRGQLSPESPIEPLVREAFFAPDTVPIGKLLSEMQGQRAKMAILIDEFGGTAGLVTQDDILEELVGRLADETDEEVRQEIAVLEPGREAVVEGHVLVEDVNQALEADLPPGAEYETVAGLIMEHLGRVPRPGDQVRVGRWLLVVQEMEGLKVRRVRIVATEGA